MGCAVAELGQLLVESGVCLRRKLNVGNQVLEIARHYKINCVATNHLPTTGKDTRTPLNEAHTITSFPHSAGGKIKDMLEEYVGLDKEQIAHMKKQNSRWATIFKNYPQVYMVERELGLLNVLDDDEQEALQKQGAAVEKKDQTV